MTAMSVLRAAEASWEVVVANDAAHAKVPRVALEVGGWLVAGWWLVGGWLVEERSNKIDMKNP